VFFRTQVESRVYAGFGPVGQGQGECQPSVPLSSSAHVECAKELRRPAVDQLTVVTGVGDLKNWRQHATYLPPIAIGPFFFQLSCSCWTTLMFAVLCEPPRTGPGGGLGLLREATTEDVGA
jgi:hypothetical protein